MNIEFVKDNIRRFNQNTSKYDIKVGIAWLSEIYCFLRFGCSPDDYFRYEFYKKSNYERKKFITYRKSQKMIHMCNDEQYRSIFDDKAKFNQFFSEYVIRDWLDLREVTEKDFISFVERHNKILLKPAQGGQGHGIIKVTAEDIQCKRILFENYRDFLAEEIIKQHHEMSTINDSSVNTVRIWTLKGEILATALRTGATGSIVDNLHSEGVCAHLNEDYGIVDYPCINNNLEKFLFHPSSRLKLVGFQIPNWEEVRTLSENAAKKIPQVGYIGWDIAIRDDGLELIEGNFDPGHDLMQMVIQNGCYGRVRGILREK